MSNLQVKITNHAKNHTHTEKKTGKHDPFKGTK